MNNTQEPDRKEAQPLVSVSFRIDHDLFVRMNAAARADQGSLAAWLRRACIEHLRNHQPGRA